MLTTDPKTQRLLARLADLQAEAVRLVRETEHVVSDADRLVARSRVLLAVPTLRIQKDDAARR